MPASARRLTPALTILAIGASIFGCNLDSNFSDLGEKLLNPDVQGFDIPGQRLLSGAHFDLSVQADAAGVRHALARDEQGTLSIVNLTKRTQCTVGVVARYGNTIFAPDQPALLPVLLRDEAGAVLLGFSTLDCQQLPFTVPAAGLPLDLVQDLPSGSGTGLLVRTPEDGLLLVDPWQATSRSLASSLRNEPLAALGHYLWVDSGSIIISNDELTPVARFGTAVAELTFSSQEAELAYIESPDGTTGGGTLLVVDALGTREPRELAQDACGLRYLGIGGSRKLAYLSPCAERRLVLRDVQDDSTVAIADGVSGGPAVHRIDGRWLITYVTGGSATGALWARAPEEGSEPVLIAENARATPSVVSLDGGGLLTLLDWSNNGGRLAEWRNGALTEVASGVFELAPLGQLENRDLTLLANFDGVTGDLLRLGSDLSTELLASGVPPRAASEDAFLANFDGEQGELRLFNRSDGSSQVLGSGVARGSFRFAQQFSAMMMLTSRDPESNTSNFEVRLLDGGGEYLLNSGVTEAREVAFPSPGFLYNVVSGDQAGVWFSKTL